MHFSKHFLENLPQQYPKVLDLRIGPVHEAGLSVDAWEGAYTIPYSEQWTPYMKTLIKETHFMAFFDITKWDLNIPSFHYASFMLITLHYITLNIFKVA